jgi:hypothetical protein
LVMFLVTYAWCEIRIYVCYVCVEGLETVEGISGAKQKLGPGTAILEHTFTILRLCTPHPSLVPFDSRKQIEHRRIKEGWPWNRSCFVWPLNRSHLLLSDPDGTQPRKPVKHRI